MRLWVFDMVRTVEKMFRRYGTQMRLCTHFGEEDFCGFLHFITSRSWQKLKREVFPLGQIPTGMYVYIGPEGYPVQEGDCLTVGDLEYVLRRTEVICYQDGPVYRWGVCARKGRDEV